MKLDILAIGVHPDDVELGCSGTILKHIDQGKKVGILDLTKGELGSRGNAKLRVEEASKAAEILGVSIRKNLGFADGFFTNDKKHQLEIIKVLREYQPDIVLANAPKDRHPDHGRASKLVSEACFYSGLVKIETQLSNKKQELWRPKAVYYYIQDRLLKPDFVVDISEHIDKKMEAIMAFRSQFYNPSSNAPETPISSKKFLAFIKARMTNFGRDINTDYAEGYTTERVIGVEDILKLR